MIEPRPCALHVGQHRLAAQVDRGQVDVLHPPPRLQAGVEDRVVVRRGDPRVVERDVDAAVGLDAPSRTSARCPPGSVTSASTNKPPSSSASAFPASASRSTTTTVAPSDASRRGGGPADAAGAAGDRRRRGLRSAPQPLLSVSRCDEDVLELGEESSASGPSSRPSPDCLNPPNGVEYRTEECELTDRLPLSTPRATRSARPTSRVQIEPDRP